VTGASFAGTTAAFFTKEQLYSTASYQAKNLGSISLGQNDLTGWNLAGQNLVAASFENATGSDTNFAGADLRDSTLQAAQFSGANLKGANLANVNMYSAMLTNADLSGADARGGRFQNATLTGADTTNLIQPDGHIAGLRLTGGNSLLVRDYHGNPAWNPPIGPLPIVIDQELAMDSTGTLRLVFDVDQWESTISFAHGIPVALGGTLELDFASGVDLPSQLGRTIDVFDWTGMTPAGVFSIQSPYSWDTSKLYTTGEITLVAVPEPCGLALLAFGWGIMHRRRRSAIHS
jgi:hypothetical protein